MPNTLRATSIVALIANARTRPLGKTQLQKLVYFLQRAGVPLNYTFEIYHYGPYSFELSQEMSSLDSLGVLSIESEPGGYGFDIRLGKFAERFTLDDKYRRKFDKVLDQFGTSTAAQLEVMATIHFVNAVMKKRSQNTTPAVIKQVKALKPRFNDHFIKGCYSDLQRSGWV
jgi:uncharacterized protein YwgA